MALILKIFSIKLKIKIRDAFIDFEYQCIAVKLFLNDQEIEIVDEITKLLENTRKDIGIWHIYYKSPNPPENWNKLGEIMDERLPKTLPALVNKLQNSFRKDYN